MRRVVLNLALLAGIVLFLALRMVGPSTTQQRNIEFFPDMARGLRFNSFSANPVFENGATLQPPVPGTLRIDTFEWRSGRGESDYVPAIGEERDNPFQAGDAAAMERGQVVYEAWCLPCHGATGAGDGPVTTRGYPEPPSLTLGGAVDMSDTLLFQIITLGGFEMPAYAAQIVPSDRWRSILYLRELQRREAAGAGGQP
ncbi:MAG: cytochrome c [Acidimicrobiia bacterium]|nr:cytochrome c [Acidimicrobiia bacterium]